MFLSVSMYASAFIADYGSSECWCVKVIVLFSVVRVLLNSEYC